MLLLDSELYHMGHLHVSDLGVIENFVVFMLFPVCVRDHTDMAPIFVVRVLPR